MSKNFYVYPGKEYLPTFKELLEISNIKINEYLSRIGIMKNINLEVEIQEIESHKKVNFSLNDKMLWDEDNYAWFYIAEIPGGTDSYFLKISELDKDAWHEECLTNDKARQLQEVINYSLDIGYHWCFRKSAGQSGIITLAYGFLAMALATITDGFIYSDDGAWDYSQFPTLADVFFGLYFNADSTSKKEYKDLVKTSIKSIYSELHLE